MIFLDLDLAERLHLQTCSGKLIAHHFLEVGEMVLVEVQFLLFCYTSENLAHKVPQKGRR